MKKIVLVDDEILVRESIREIVDWEREGFLFCGDAPDGEMALPLIDRCQPDILIVDIKMPFMDGLELTRIVREKYPHMKIVILTGHDEFEYARTALRLRVTEYCLKPITSSELLSMLKSIAERIDREQKEKELLEEFLNDNRSLKHQKLLSDICTGLISTPEALHLAALLDMNLTSRHYNVVITEVIRTDGNRFDVPNRVMNEITRFLETRLTALSDIDVLSYQRSRTETVWMLKSDNESMLQTSLHALKHHILPEIAIENDYDVVIGIGSMQQRLQGIHNSYLAADMDKTIHYLFKNNDHKMRQIPSNQEQSFAWVDQNRLIEFLKIGTRDQIDEFILQYACRLKQIDWESHLYGHFLLNHLTLTALHVAHEYFDADMIEPIYHRWQESIQGVRSFEEACDYLKRLTRQVLEWREETANRHLPIILKAKDFICKRYHRSDLSLHQVAEHVNVSPSHLSKIFSQQTGTTFIEYLTQIRIQKAMELLLTTNLKIYEVAERSGYNDSHYFSNLFKKVTGMTTREFRKAYSEQGNKKARGGFPYEAVLEH